MIIWNPWHGCHKVSEGCQHCYMYFLDGKRGIDTSKVYRTENFNLPVQRRRDGRFKLPSGTKRASRIKDCLPKDWGDGYENVLLQVSTEIVLIHSSD